LRPGEPCRDQKAMKASGGKRTWFGVDLREGVSPGGSWFGFYPGLLELLTSAYTLVGLVLIVVLAAGYLMILEPLLGSDAAQREQLKALRIRQAALAQEKEILLQEAAELVGLEAQSPGWAGLLEALAEKVVEGVWLSRVSLEEEKGSKARRSTGGAQSELKESRLLMVVEGKVDTRRYPSALEPVSQMIRELKGDPRFGSVVSNLELASTQVSKDDPFLVSFELKGIWSPEAWKGKPQERVRQILSQDASPKGGPAGGKSQ